MKKQIILLLIFILTAAVQNGLSKILVVCEYGLHNYPQIGQYVDDVTNIDHKTVERVYYLGVPGDNVAQCLDLRTCIEASYSSGVDNHDLLEGVVLIGDLPVPILYSQDIGDPLLYDFSNMPNDYFYMDIWNQNTNQAYPNNGAGIFSTANNIHGDGSNVFVGLFTSNQVIYGQYNTPGDNVLDIWVSRICPSNLNHLRDNSGNLIFDYDIIGAYLDRVDARMNNPALVPSRGFAMGGPSDFNSLDNVIGQDMKTLNLPWFVEFTDGQNSAFNWMSQLQAGPSGNVNYGAFNGSQFPNEYNRRYCLYSQLPSAYDNGLTTYTTTNDNAGWEWAGIYNHGVPHGFSANCVGGWPWPLDTVMVGLSGGFSTGTIAPFWGQAFHSVTGGYIDNSGFDNGYFYYNNDTTGVPDPYHFTNWKGKSAYWRWKVQPGQVGVNGSCNVFLGYLTNSSNAPHVLITILRESCGTDGTPLGWELSGDTITVDQTYHSPNTLPMSGTHNVPYWEPLAFTNHIPVSNLIYVNVGDMIIVTIDANAYIGSGRPQPTERNVIADAVMFRSTNAGIPDVIINCNTQPYIPDYAQINQPFGILAATAFYTNDDVDRSFEDMQDEAADHSAVSLVPFFLSACCETNWFTNSRQQGDCIGNLFALGHNGLISVGHSTVDFPDYNIYKSFTDTLAAGKDIGQAFRAKAQEDWRGPDTLICTLLGAGSLRAQPYIQYGTTSFTGETFPGGTLITLYSPILLTNMTITAYGGDVSVFSTTNPGFSPLCSHSEIVIRPETHIYPPTAGNIVDIKAQ